MTEDPFRRRRSIEMRTPRDNRFQPHTPLGAGAEFDIIRRMLERWGPRARRIGDDAAVITSIGDRALVVSTDTSVENVHFRKDWLTPAEIGYRATAAALSDLAAMGARPLGILVAMAIPEEWRPSIDQLSDGIGDAAAAAEAPILGGDMSKGEQLSITVTALGTARSTLFRTGAHAGDSVYVTGRLGGSQAALRVLRAGGNPEHAIRDRFAHPVPRIGEAQWLAENGATAAIDISDGLASDLAHIASASKLRVNVNLDDVPTFEGVRPIDAVTSGEEYELAVVAPSRIDTAAFSSRFALDLTLIGSIDRGAPGVVFSSNGQQIDVGGGYLHFQ